MFETQMIDSKTFRAEASSERRNELMRNVSTLFAIASENCTHEQIDIYDSVLSRLADMVEVEARSFAARKLAPLRRAPHGIVMKLSTDDIAVAAPLLSQSPVLTDGDLVAIADRNEMAYLEAIAERPVLSDRVTDALVARGDSEVRRKVAANSGALFSEEGFERLAEEALRDVATAAALNARSDTPDAVIERLVAEATEEVRRIVEGRNSDRLDEAGRIATERMSNSYWLNQFDFETAYARLNGLGGRAVVSEQLLVQLALDERFADAVAAFSLMTGISLEQAKHWMVRTDPEPFLVVASARGLRHATVQILLKTGPWRHRLTPAVRIDALNRYQRLDADKSRAALFGLGQEFAA
jgi:hypothetical protein